ncbi:MAG: cytidine deaminase [Candidatus Korobacteraceae bacterium]|jgi:cytidine deaminase
MHELSTEQSGQLLAAAQQASERAYAPFSGFHVGAAVLTQGGEIFTGCNVENSSYGLTNCAERTAIFTAVAAGALGAQRTLIAVAVVDHQGAGCTPCGACRQVIFEFGPEAVVIYRAQGGEITQTKIQKLLPEGFRLL